jgi:hypothetical protein
MKTKVLLFVASMIISATAIRAEKAVAGPAGGRLLDTEPARAEFVINAARKGEIRFYDAALKPLAPVQQVVTVTAEPAAGRVKLEVEKTEFGFVTKEAMPAGDPYRVVVQVRATPEAKPQNFRLDLALGNCGGCQRAEYACTCESH